MTHPIIKTDNYILITSDEEIKLQDWCILFDSAGNILYGIPLQYTDSKNQHINKYLRKIIAHLPPNNSPILEGVPLLPPLLNEEDNLYNEAQVYAVKSNSSNIEARRKGYVDGFLKAKEKYKFTEEDIKEAFRQARVKTRSLYETLEYFSQPKLPVGFKCEIEVECTGNDNNGCFMDAPGHDCGCVKVKIINGVMQGEWIF